MKARIITNKGKYVPQIKFWLIGWFSIGKRINGEYFLSATYDCRYDTIDECKRFIDDYIKQEIDVNKVIWKNY